MLFEAYFSKFYSFALGRRVYSNLRALTCMLLTVLLKFLYCGTVFPFIKPWSRRIDMRCLLSKNLVYC